jgi:hypothetical protein
LAASRATPASKGEVRDPGRNRRSGRDGPAKRTRSGGSRVPEPGRETGDCRAPGAVQSRTRGRGRRRLPRTRNQSARRPFRKGASGERETDNFGGARKRESLRPKLWDGEVESAPEERGTIGATEICRRAGQIESRSRRRCPIQGWRVLKGAPVLYARVLIGYDRFV